MTRPVEQDERDPTKLSLIFCGIDCLHALLSSVQLLKPSSIATAVVRLDGLP